MKIINSQLLKFGWIECPVCHGYGNTKTGCFSNYPSMCMECGGTGRTFNVPEKKESPEEEILRFWR